jgi:hypothetical protein
VRRLAGLRGWVDFAEERALFFAALGETDVFTSCSDATVVDSEFMRNRNQ